MKRWISCWTKVDYLTFALTFAYNKLIGCLLKTTAEFLLKCFLCHHLFLDLSGPKVRVKVETSLAVDKIESIAHDDGLQPDQIVKLVKLATSGKYGKFQLILWHTWKP